MNITILLDCLGQVLSLDVRPHNAMRRRDYTEMYKSYGI